MFASLNPGHIGIHGRSLRDSLALAERHGFGGLDVQLAPLHAEVGRLGANAVRDLFFAHGLRIGAWNLPFMPYRVGEDEYRRELAKLPPLLASAAALGARRAGMWILSGSDERAYDENFAHHVARFQPVARMLADHGIRLGLEFVGPLTSQRAFKHPFIRSLQETLALARAVGPNCGVLIDAWHWHCVGGTREELRALRRDLLVHVHIDDAPAGIPRDELIDSARKLPATTGVIDLDGFMQALAHADYDGPVTAEPFDEALSALPAEESTARTAKATRNAVARALREVDLGR